MKIDKQSLNNNISSGGNKSKLNLVGLAYQNLSKSNATLPGVSLSGKGELSK